MEAIILAGGFGTRLREVVSDVPKSMAPINGKPFLEYLFRHLLNQGITKFVLSVGYRSEVIISHFGDRFESLEISYVVEEEPMGTGGGARLAFWKIEGDRALVLNGDSLFHVDYRKMTDFHLARKAAVTIALRQVEDTGRYGNVKMNRNGRITHFSEKTDAAGPGLINGGVYIIEKSFLLEPWFRGRFSIEKDCFAKYLEKSRIYGFPSPGYFLDIGIPADYQKAQYDFTRFTC